MLRIVHGELIQCLATVLVWRQQIRSYLGVRIVELGTLQGIGGVIDEHHARRRTPS